MAWQDTVEVKCLMPTYEYLCKTCSHRFETWQKMTDEPLTECPECGSTIRRVLYPAGVVFKGAGFYKTDHASNGYKESATSATKSESESTSTTKTSESTPAASSETKSTPTASTSTASK